MAQREQTDARRERASGREQRRRLTSQPLEELDDAADDGAGNGGGPVAAAKQAARTAAAAAIAGGLAGAAKALVARRRRGDDEEQDAPEPERAEPRSEPVVQEPQSGHDGEPVAEESSDEPTAEADEVDVDEDEQPRTVPAQARPGSAGTSDRPDRGASASEASDIVARARDHVAALLGKEAESISGIARGNGSWTVSVEVVEIHRVPDTTDVLSSYEVVLDDGGDLLSLERRGRYRRSQIEEGR